MDLVAGMDDNLLDQDLLNVMLALRAKNATRPALTTITPQLMRSRAASEFVVWNQDAEAVANVENFSIMGQGGDIGLRFYDPCPEKCTGLHIYFHGGGWVIGDLDLEDAILRRIANRSGVKILSVDYRLAPEHPFPAAIEDGDSVVNYVVSHAKTLNIDPTRIGLGGGSAGANVALGTALRVRDSQGPSLAHLYLKFGCYSQKLDSHSVQRFANGRFGLPKAAMDFFWDSYLGDHAPHPHAIPILATLNDLPPSLIIEAELDVLADDSSHLAKMMRDEGVEVDHRVITGVMHGFTSYFSVCERSRQVLDAVADVLAVKLG